MGVSQLLGKLFGGDADKNETVLRAYGKLPMYAEYRRLEVAPGTPTQFSQWMDAGRLAWVRSPTKTDAGTTRPSRLMLRPPEAKELVVASVWDSRDSLGRVFPFAFFVVCSPDALGGNSLERWAAATAIHEVFNTYHGQLGSLGAGGDFYRLYRKRPVCLRPEDIDQRTQRLAELARGIPAIEWFNAAIGDDTVDPGEWFTGLVRRANRWKSQPGTAAEMVVNLPVAGTFSRAAQAILWLQWIEGFVGRGGRTPGVIAPAESVESTTSLSLIARDTLPDDFQLLTTDDNAYGFAERVATIPPATGDSATTLVVDAPGGSLLDWIIKHAS